MTIHLPPLDRPRSLCDGAVFFHHAFTMEVDGWWLTVLGRPAMDVSTGDSLRTHRAEF